MGNFSLLVVSPSLDPNIFFKTIFSLRLKANVSRYVVTEADRNKSDLETSRLVFLLKLKININFALKQAMKTHSGSRCIALLFLQPQR